MHPEYLRRLLVEVREGRRDVEEALEDLKHLPYEDLDFAKIDNHRALRMGFPETVFCQGKTVEQVALIMERLQRNGTTVLATRAGPEVYEAVRAVNPKAIYHTLARCIVIEGEHRPRARGTVLVVSAGTADLPVAEEAAVTADVTGSNVERLYDVGVAGLHRLLDNRLRLQSADVVIAVAGMEGALASVVGGLVDRPVIAVPTSVGYGASFNGLAPLLTMLNSCAPGIAVVNIDNGYGAGYMASVINWTTERKERECASPTSTASPASPVT